MFRWIAVFALALPAPGAEALKILVLQGERAINNTQTRAVTPPVVEVRNASDQPVAGAEVIFQLPQAGPGGYFADQQLNMTAITNSEGQAAAPFTVNGETGRFKITVHAKHQGSIGQTEIRQTNSDTTFDPDPVLEPKRNNLWKILAVGAGAAVGGIVLATRGGGSGVIGGPPIALNPGPVVIGGPR